MQSSEYKNTGYSHNCFSTLSVMHRVNLSVEYDTNMLYCL